ncbi:hypothetical protein EIP86_001251 [Pleurotus ostreatoroseus]|nr:hypothetical protein EIP86_001251 [Pleurotus ostreatoroseus]
MSFTSHPISGHYRLSSSLPPASPDQSKLASKPIPPTPPTSTAVKKPKVELRPAPVKPNPSDVFPKSAPSVSPTPRPATTANAPDNGVQASSLTTKTEKIPHREGVIESAQHDFEYASSHGILAPPPPGANKLQKLIHQAKEFFKFYWNGIKLINTNRLRTNRMRARVAAGGPPLTRWETRFVQTYKQDALKLIPFALIIIIAEEAIPFVVMWAPFLLPSTCILPAQRERIAGKKRAQQTVIVETQKNVFEDILKRSSSEKDVLTLLGQPEAKALGGLLRQSSYTFGFSSLRTKRIQRYLTSISQDDALLQQEGFGERLTDAELREALDERGILTEGLTPKQWRSRLHWWLTNVDASSTGVDIDPVSRRVLLIARSVAGKL